MKSIPLAARLRYRFDNTLAKGTVALIIWLAIVSSLLVLMATILFTLFELGPAGSDGIQLGFLETLWFNLMRTFDPGAVSGDLGTWPFLLSTLVVSLGGLFIASVLIGLLTTGIETKIMELRKGRSLVVEKDHTVILGWAPHIFSIVSNLIIANENCPSACIVILADRDKVEMEDEFRARLRSTGTVRLVCRSGNPADPTDLAIANLDSARSIIMVSPQCEDPDMHIIKMMLAITHNPHRRSEPYNIVAEIHNNQNLQIARMVGGDEVQLVHVGDLVSRIAVQTCRQSGLSRVYMELLDFAGNEIYFQEEPMLVGKRFDCACLSYESAAVIGLRFSDGRILLNPPSSTVIAEGDQVIAVAEDDDRVIFTGSEDITIDEEAIRHSQPPAPLPEKTLILGWNHRVKMMLQELDEYVASGSSTTVVTIAEIPEPVQAELHQELRNQELTIHPVPYTDRRVLDSIDVPQFDHVIVVPYSDIRDDQEADALTLVMLLHLRDIAERFGRSFSIVSEMLDVRNRELAEITQVDDFIVDEKLVSMMLSQVAENSELTEVFAELFDAEGSELYLKPIEHYIELGRPVNFYTVVESAERRDEIAIGYRLASAANNAALNYGIWINPDKKENVTFGPDDRVIVLAES